MLAKAKDEARAAEHKKQLPAKRRLVKAGLMKNVEERLTVKNLKKYLRDGNSAAVANQVNKNNMVEMFEQCSGFHFFQQEKLILECHSPEYGSDASESEQKSADEDSEKTESDAEMADSENDDYWSKYSYILLHPRVSSAHFQKHFPAVHYSIDFKRSSNSSILCTGIAESVSHDLCLHSTKTNNTAMEFRQKGSNADLRGGKPAFYPLKCAKIGIWEIVRIKKKRIN